jgi:hypothetical protein
MLNDGYLGNQSNLVFPISFICYIRFKPYHSLLPVYPMPLILEEFFYSIKKLFETFPNILTFFHMLVGFDHFISNGFPEIRQCFVYFSSEFTLEFVLVHLKIL